MLLLSFTVCATDTTKLNKHPLISFNAGYTTSTVYGSMVDRNNQFGNNVKMKQRGGFLVNVYVRKNISNLAFVRSGLGYIHKQVAPMVNTIAIYKDVLNTSYLFIPAEVGVDILPITNPVNFSLSFGAVANVRIADKSNSGPDRVNFKTNLLTGGITGGVVLGIQANKTFKLLIRYSYFRDLSKSYVENLYWSSEEPNKEFVYKYQTHAISLGIQWAIR